MMQRIETTCADLRMGDMIVDRSGKAWPVAGLEVDSGESISFWLCDPISRVRLHPMTRPLADTVTVERVQTHADEAARLEAEMPGQPDSYATMEDAVEAVEADLGGEIDAVVTAEEHDAAAAATEDTPVALPPFADMTPLEMRSHLYLLHGVYAADMRSIAETIAMHDDAHAGHEAGTLRSRHIPHTHDGSVTR